MPSTNHIKFGSSEINSATRGGFKVGVKGGADYGPTSVKGFWNGITPPVGGYTIYVDKASQGPSIHVANDDNQCIFFLKSFGSTGSTIGNVLDWADGQSNILVVTSELVIGDLSGGGGGNTGGPGWYFYSDEGPLNAEAPTANGNALFLTAFGGNEVFDPNQSDDYNLFIFFNTINSVGANFTGDFNGATEPGGVVTITQGSNVAEYSNPNGIGMRLETFGPLAGVFIIETEDCIQTQTAASAFNQNDVITLAFS